MANYYFDFVESCILTVCNLLTVHANEQLFSMFIILWIAVFEIILFQLDFTSKWYWYYSTWVLIIPKKIKTCFNIHVYALLFYQICMGIAMFTAMETKKNILYIDTGGSLSATRIKDMLQEWNASLDEQVWATLKLLWQKVY